jgi:hypothetical protein
MYVNDSRKDLLRVILVIIFCFDGHFTLQEFQKIIRDFLTIKMHSK